MIPRALVLSVGIAGLLGFLLVAYGVRTHGATFGYDIAVLDWMRAHHTTQMDFIMQAISCLGSGAFIGLLMVGALLLLVNAEAWAALRLLLGTVLGGMLLNTLVKFLLHRPRPQEITTEVPLTEFSFPSGHTAAATLLYGLLAVFISSRTCNSWWRFVVYLCAIFLVLGVAYSRVYLRVHYLSDVIAAICLHTAWLMMALVLSQWVEPRSNPAE